MLLPALPFSRSMLVWSLIQLLEMKGVSLFVALTTACLANKPIYADAFAYPPRAQILSTRQGSSTSGSLPRSRRSNEFSIYGPIPQLRKALLLNMNPNPRILSPLRLLKRKKRKKSGGVTLAATVLFSLVSSCVGLPEAASAAVSNSVATFEPMQLGWRQLILAASLLTVSGGLGLYLVGLPSLARSLAVAATRCTLQLYLIGGFVLTNFLITSGATSWMIMSWIIFTGCLGAQEAASRVEYTYPMMQAQLTLSLLLSGFLVLGATLALRILGPLEPWFQPRTWIPVAGMLFGNALTAVSLGAAALTRGFVSQRNQIELLLARGASWREATSAMLKTTLTTALTPTINALSVTGIVHIPGMMTGQLLAGQRPYQAAAYQVLIFFLLASMSITTVLLYLRMAIAGLVDKVHHRLCMDALAQRERDKASAASLSSLRLLPSALVSGVASMMKKVEQKGLNEETPINGSSAEPRKVQLIRRQERNETPPVLSLKEMSIPRTDIRVTLDAYTGDRIGILGKSGAGKSQFLRALVGLDSRDGESIFLSGTVATQYSAPVWRRHVSLIPQDRSAALDGTTPRDLFEQACQFKSQREERGDISKASPSLLDPYELATEWDLSESALDQPWSTLSGGEAQRASLAIAVALRPDVLLLDESTSALDEPTAIKVEATLKRLGIPILVVSHSRAQVDRFCNHFIDLDDSFVGFPAQWA